MSSQHLAAGWGEARSATNLTPMCPSCRGRACHVMRAPLQLRREYLLAAQLDARPALLAAQLVVLSYGELHR